MGFAERLPSSWSPLQKLEMLDKMLKIAHLYNQKHDFMDFSGVKFPYTEAQEVYSFGKVLEHKGLTKDPEAAKLIAQMTSLQPTARPNMQDVISQLEKLNYTDEKHKSLRM